MCEATKVKFDRYFVLLIRLFNTMGIIADSTQWKARIHTPTSCITQSAITSPTGFSGKTPLTLKFQNNAKTSSCAMQPVLKCLKILKKSVHTCKFLCLCLSLNKDIIMMWMACFSFLFPECTPILILCLLILILSLLSDNSFLFWTPVIILYLFMSSF